MMIELFLIFVLGVFLGWVSSNAWNRWLFEELLTRLNISDRDLINLTNELETEEAQEGDHLPELEIRVEQVNGCLFAYSVEDDRFIAQGKDREQLLENLVHNLNQVRVICHDDQGAHYITP